jgi:hypothetical protein
MEIKAELAYGLIVSRSVIRWFGKKGSFLKFDRSDDLIRFLPYHCPEAFPAVSRRVRSKVLTKCGSSSPKHPVDLPFLFIN